MSDLFVDRTPPYSLEAEQAVLGAIFLAPDVFVTASEIIIPEDFYRPAHQKIYQIMLTIFNKVQPVDLVTVITSLADTNLLEEVGGVGYLNDIANSVSTAVNIEYYARIIEEKSILRRL